jgi:hypothetical protein
MTGMNLMIFSSRGVSASAARTLLPLASFSAPSFTGNCCLAN